MRGGCDGSAQVLGRGWGQENNSQRRKRFLLISHALPVCHARPSANFHKTLKTCRFFKSCIKCAVEVKTRTNVTVKEMRTHGRNRDWDDRSPPPTTNPEESASWEGLAGAGPRSLVASASRRLFPIFLV